MESIEDFNEKMQLIGQLRDVSGELQELNKNTGSAVLQQSLFERIISRAQAGFPAQNLAVMLNELRPKLLQIDPLDPWILDVTLEAGRLKARGSQLLIGEELNQFIGKVTEWKTKYDKSTGDKPDTPASEKEDLTGKEPRAQTTVDGGLSPQIPEVSTTGPPVTPLTITANDNLGTFQGTLKKAFTYWMSERPKLEIKDPFVRYTFTSMEEARVAVMELPCMRIAQDRRVAICTELLIYGWYQVDEGRYEAILCGPDMTWNLWQAAKKSFKMHGGVLKDELSPSEHSIDYQMAPLTTPVFCKEEHAFSPDRKIVHKLYSAPNIRSAIEFLKQNPVTQEDFKIIVETPDGVYSRDFRGIFKEPLQRARVEYLRDLEIHVLMDGTMNESIVNLVEKKPIPIVKGKPVVSPAALDAVMLKLISQKRLRGIAWNGIFFSETESVIGATNYSLYRHTSFITELNTSVQLLTVGNVLQFKDTLTINGVYYYVVIASGSFGNSSISNCLDVTVEIPAAIDYVSILLWVGIAIAVMVCIVIPVRRSRLNRDSRPTRRQQPQKKVPEGVRSQFLEQVKASILADAEFQTGIISFTGKFPIPTHHGVPVVSDRDISNFVQELAMKHHLEGMVWNDVFYSDAAMLNILKSLAENHNEISIDDLVGKVPEIDPRGIKILLKHLLESQQLPYILDLQRNILKFKLPVDPSTLKILIGIVRIDKHIDLNKASEVLRLPRARIMELIEMLKRDGIVEGDYDGEIFRIRSDVGKFIEDLNRQFHLWNDLAGTKKE